MPGPVEHRTVSPLIKWISQIGRGRPFKQPHRFADEQADRTQPPPNLPDGPYHKTSQIYYYTHDARREVQPPMVISYSKRIGTDSKQPKSEDKKSTTPGKVHKWD